ncbi:MAG: sigma-70 family RNA polymerase sigma factor, partial [Verrucomicrobiae bacterium]|nr:sigma-70 family RNA polymerase sigma factor [Verrucomicrobiae bacterium]
ALVHEAYCRLVGDRKIPWGGPGHFYAAAAEAMRRIVIDGIRRKQARKHGGGQQRVEFDAVEIPAGVADDELLAVNEALDRFEEREPETAQLVKLRFFAGLTLVEAADALGLSERTARRRWNYARAWLYDEIQAS